MTPKEKGRYLVKTMTKKYALICINEIIKDRERLKDSLFYNSNYWVEVKQEIEKQ